ncbi:MAG TPA: CGNR zinc finger domain-containing protein [Jiangellaceae bacterium]
MREGNQLAPGRLEDVRTLLNTWLIPNDTRVAEDRFDAYAERNHIPAAERSQLRLLRDDLRRVAERSVPPDGIFNRWIDRLGVRPEVASRKVGFQHAGGVSGETVVICLAALSSGEWSRLKACPDCRWVFYDHSRNESKRWCLMTAGGPDGRSCGSIAKVRAYRARARQTG